MTKTLKIFKFNLPRDSDFIEIGGGRGELSCFLIKKGFHINLFIEPDINKYKIASKKLKNVNCINEDISNIDLNKLNKKFNKVTVIMQDVIEHISFEKQKIFFKELSKKYDAIYLIGRTPNLKSPFGLRNSFGDNTHLYRFTDSSLKDFLKELGFSFYYISSEPYQITGIISFLRFIPYFLIIIFTSFLFLFVYGKWEGFLTPNLIFHSKKI